MSSRFNSDTLFYLFAVCGFCLSEVNETTKIEYNAVVVVVSTDLLVGKS